MPRCAYPGGCDRLVRVGEGRCSLHRRKLPTATTLVRGEDQRRTEEHRVWTDSSGRTWCGVTVCIKGERIETGAVELDPLPFLSPSIDEDGQIVVTELAPIDPAPIHYPHVIAHKSDDDPPD